MVGLTGRDDTARDEITLASEVDPVADGAHLALRLALDRESGCRQGLPGLGTIDPDWSTPIGTLLDEIGLWDADEGQRGRAITQQLH